jgi:hypothetical protein
LVLRVFFNSPTHSHLWKQGLCCLFVIFLRLVLEYFSTVPTHFYLWKQGLSVLPFVIPFLCLVLRVFFSPTQFLPMKAGIEWCCSWFLSLCLVLRVFFNSPTQSLPKAGLSDAAFVIPFFVFGLKSIFQQSHPISTYESRDWVMLLFCDSFLCVWS